MAGTRPRGRLLLAPLRAHNYRTAASLLRTFPDPVSREDRIDILKIDTEGTKVPHHRRRQR